MNPNQPVNPFQVSPQPGATAGPQPQPVPTPAVNITGTPPPAPQTPQPGYPSSPTPPVYGYSQLSQPMSFQQPSSGTKLKKIIIASAAVLVVAALAGGAVLLSHKSTNNPISSLTNAVKGDSDVVSRSDGTLDLSKLIDDQTTIKNQDIKAKLNQQVNLSDGTSYMILSVARNFTTDSIFLKAGSGKELVKVSLVIGNKKKEGNLYADASIFKIKNSAGGLQEPVYANSSDLADAINSQDVAPGKQLKGSIVFEVDKDEPINAILTSDQFKNYSTNENVTINSEVALQ